ncbi:MAG: CRISPR-associated endonuclease Cas2 [Candidatus Pacebacteria bacterium]|nr:CRISPR-associated endonuclease Cas2 [Candidatus Paceibacterota bacterium]
MTIKQDLLNLFNTKFANYKGIDVNIFGLPVFKNKNSKSIKNAYYSLCDEGYLSTEDKNIILTKKGQKYLKDKLLSQKIFEFSYPQNAPKNLLVMYDIPEDKKPERDWFRRHLHKFGYIMIQRSVWVGPSPLPKEFMDYVKKIGLKDNLKTFKLEKGYDGR